MATQNLIVLASAADGYVTDIGQQIDFFTYDFVGTASGSRRKAYWRFVLTAAITQGDTVSVGTLRLRCANSESGGWSAVGKCQLANNPGNPSSYADYTGRTFTTATTTTYTSGLETAGVDYDFDFTSPLQELVNAYNFSIGDAILLELGDTGSSATQRWVTSYNGSTTDCARLTLTTVGPGSSVPVPLLLGRQNTLLRR